jgi:hypothetical protein
MKIPHTRSASRYFDLKRVPGERDAIPVEPEDPAPIHAYLLQTDPDLRSTAERWILNQPGTAFLEFGAEESACGMGVRVVYRMAFDNSDGDACSRCVEMVELWRTDHSEYMRRVEERHEIWEERERRHYAAVVEADMVREHSYGTDPIEEDESD